MVMIMSKKLNQFLYDYQILINNLYYLDVDKRRNFFEYTDEQLQTICNYYLSNNKQLPDIGEIISGVEWQIANLEKNKEKIELGICEVYEKCDYGKGLVKFNILRIIVEDLTIKFVKDLEKKLISYNKHRNIDVGFYVREAVRSYRCADIGWETIKYAEYLKLSKEEKIEHLNKTFFKERFWEKFKHQLRDEWRWLVEAEGSIFKPEQKIKIEKFIKNYQL